MLVKNFKGEDVLGLLTRFESVFTVVSLIIYMGAVVPLLITQGQSEGDGIDIFSFDYTPLNLLFISNYLITTSLFFLRWQKVLFFVSRNLLFVAFMLLVPLSFAWSAIPEQTLTASVGMFGTTFFGLYIASRFTLQEQLELIAWAFGIIMLLSIVFVIALPKYGIMAAVHHGSIRGVFTHKNGLGKYMVLASAVFLLLALNSSSRKMIPRICLAASFGFILASSSTSALFNGVMIVGTVLLLSRLVQLRTALLLPILILMLIIGWSFSVLLIDIVTPILDLFGKDLTLTGRTDIWPAVIEKIQQRPLLGYGFSAFWFGMGGESADIIRTVRWPVPDSHNGFLDLTLQLGLLGLGMFFFVTWITLVKAFAIARVNFSSGSLWPIILIVYAFLINFSESTLMSQNSFFWIIYTSVVFSVAAQFKGMTSSNLFTPDLSANPRVEV